MLAATHNDILNYVRAGNSSVLTTAEPYLQSLAHDIGKAAAAFHFGFKSYGMARKKARSVLSLHCPDYEFKSIGESVDLPDGVIAAIDSVASNVQKDWDGDIVRSDGLIFDTKSPLLRNHEANSVIGRYVKTLSQTEKSVSCRYWLADTPLSRDSLALMKIGALRKSIGFRVLRAHPIETKDASGASRQTGFDIESAAVLETSSVSIPANPTASVVAIHEKAYDAARSLASKGFEDPVMKLWGKALLDSRTTVVKGATLETKVEVVKAAEPVASAPVVAEPTAVPEPVAPEPAIEPAIEPATEKSAPEHIDTPQDLRRLLAKAATGEIDATGMIDVIEQTATLLGNAARASELRELVPTGA